MLTIEASFLFSGFLFERAKKTVVPRHVEST